MAEIGLVASVFSVAAFGTSVATTLYEAADIMINARQQISALARHVSQFTAVLKHMGEVLETEKANCSKELLRDIRKIKHSCKRTFREINSTVKSKRFRRFVPLKWLFRRTKAMELEARLDSQQSMLQCIIHTLTVSKLGHIDSRSKHDSEHLTGLRMEIKLLKTFIMESYNTLTELRHAEQLTEIDEVNHPTQGGGDHPGLRYQEGDGITLLSNGVSNAHELRITRSPSPNSSASKSENEDFNSGGADVGSDSTKSKDQDDQDGTRPKVDDSNTKGLIPRLAFQRRSSYHNIPDSTIHRESNLLLQMVPYKPKLPYRLHSDRLIHGEQIANIDTKPAIQDATNSVRLLLDKWTTSGSAPVSNILDEEASRTGLEAKPADDLLDSDSQFGPHRFAPPLPPEAETIEDNFGPTDYPGLYGNSSRIQDNPMSSPLPRDSRRPQYTYSPYGIPDSYRKDFWKPSNLHPPLDRQLGAEILSALRCNKGGIYYTKSNQFQQVHYVDQYPIYTCAFVPPEIIPDNEWKPLNTEVGRGSMRREALDLLGYSYTETEMGTFSISGDLELRDIEEIVNLSYQALDRYSRLRSKTVIKERGWGEAVDAMNRVPGEYLYDPPVGPYHYRPVPERWNHNEAPYGGYSRSRARTEYEDFAPDESALRRAQMRRPRAREYPHIRARERTLSASIPIEAKHRGQELTQSTLPEVRFTLPRVHTVSSAANTVNEAQANPVNPDAPLTKTAEELQKARQRLEQVKQRKEAAKTAKDHATENDLTYYVIPDLNIQIEKLQQQQQQEQQQGEEEQEKRTAPTSRSEDDKRSHHTEVETESEYSYDEDESRAQDLYD